MNATVWLTEDCNMTCSYCYESHQKKNKRFMTEDIADKVIDFLFDHNKRIKNDKIIINLLGGEPLLNYPIMDYIVNRVKTIGDEKGISVHFGTTINGTLLKEEYLDFLCENFDFGLSISIDGAKLSHDCNRFLPGASSAYDELIKWIPKLLERRPDLRGRMTITPETIGMFSDNIKHMIDLGFKIIVPVPDYFNLNWNEKDYQLFYSEAVEIKKLMENMDDDIEVGIIDNYPQKQHNGICSGGKETLSINPVGDIFPCSYSVNDERFKIGHISLGIKNDKVLELVDLNKIKNEECDGCSNYNRCSATRCKLVNKLICGDYHSPPEVLCQEQNIKYRINN